MAAKQKKKSTEKKTYSPPAVQKSRPAKAVNRRKTYRNPSGLGSLGGMLKDLAPVATTAGGIKLAEKACDFFGMNMYDLEGGKVKPNWIRPLVQIAGGMVVRSVIKNGLIADLASGVMINGAMEGFDMVFDDDNVMKAKADFRKTAYPSTVNGLGNVIDYSSIAQNPQNLRYDAATGQWYEEVYEEPQYVAGLAGANENLPYLV